MNIATPSTLLLAVAADAPALYDAFVTHEMDVATALTRYLIAVPVCGIMLAVLRMITKDYQEDRQRVADEAHAAEAAIAAEERELELEQERAREAAMADANDNAGSPFEGADRRRNR